MSFKIVLAFCAQALLIQNIHVECIGVPLAAAPLAAAPCAGAWGAPYAIAEWDYAPAAALSASNGPSVTVTTASPLIPAGVSVLSENAYEGTLAVEGTLPFLGTVAFEGALPTAGAGAVAYSCSNGAIGITAEESGPIGYGAGFVGPLGYGTVGAYTPAASLAASNGPGLAISSTSTQIPSGVIVQSENAYEGGLAVGGAVPFLGTVAFEGVLPTSGVGATAYACGNGAIDITNESLIGGAVDFGGILGSAFPAPFGYAGPGWGYASF